MAFKYETVVPWGRSFEEYQRMFALTEQDLNLRIVGCGDGPASFNAHMAERGRRVVSAKANLEIWYGCRSSTGRAGDGVG